MYVLIFWTAKYETKSVERNILCLSSNEHHTHTHTHTTSAVGTRTGCKELGKWLMLPLCILHLIWSKLAGETTMPHNHENVLVWNRLAFKEFFEQKYFSIVAFKTCTGQEVWLKGWWLGDLGLSNKQLSAVMASNNNRAYANVIKPNNNIASSIEILCFW